MTLPDTERRDASQTTTLPLCPLCDIGVAVRLDRLRASESDRAYRIAACPRCELGLTLPVPDDLSAYYTEDYYGNRHGVTGTWCDRRRLGLLNRVSGGLSERRLLDVGCGDGSFLLAARRAGWRVTGLESHPKLARQSGLDVVESWNELRPPFDCITLWHVLEHLPDPIEVVRRLKQNLATGGCVLLAVPDARSASAIVAGSAWLHWDVPRHLFHYSRRSLEELFRTQGMEITFLNASEFEYDLMGWVQSGLNRLMREPNVFFRMLTGRRTSVGWPVRWLNLGLGASMMAVMTLPTWASGRLGRGGTLIAVARMTTPVRQCGGEPDQT